MNAPMWQVGTPVEDWREYFIRIGFLRYIDPDTGKLWRPRRARNQTLNEWEWLDLRDILKCCVHRKPFQDCRCFAGMEWTPDPWDE